MSTFSKLLRRRRMAAALSQSALGERLGVSSSTISRWERDIDLPEDVRLVEVGRFLRIPSSDLERMIGVGPGPARAVPKIEDRIADLEARVGEIVTILGRLSDRIAFDSERVALTAGNREIEVDDGAGTIEISDGSGNTVVWDSAGVTVTGGVRVTVNAPIVDVIAATFNVEAAITNLYGVAKCQTLITNTVIAKTYTTGAGNVW